MKFGILLGLFAISFAFVGRSSAVEPLPAAEPLYELRIYQPEPGKQADMLRFLDEDAMEMAKGMGLDLVGAWTPTDPKDSRIITLVRHADRPSCDALYEKMYADPKFQAAFAKAFPGGNSPVKSLTRVFMNATDYSPKLGVDSKGERVFELRTYIASSNNLSALNSRFRDHTLKLFEKHGMKNVIYWNIAPGETMLAKEMLPAVSPLEKSAADIPADLSAVENTLVYFISHASEDAAKASFDSFRQDAEWNKVRTESEKAAGGSLTAGNGVKSWFLKPTSFSPLK